MSEPRKINILTVDDHPLLRKGIASLIESHPDLLLVGQASTGSEGIHQFSQHEPDVTLMDLRLPDMSGIEAIVAIRAKFPAARIIVLSTAAGDVEIKDSLEAGACGYLLKTMPPDELVNGIRQVHQGKNRIPSEIASLLAENVGSEKLTNREIEVLRLVPVGNRNRDIAAKLSISELTVKAHLQHILEKLNANDRTQAVTIALKRGIISM
jgi:DNA-binding NarL/FixJ family response regulator